MVKIDISNYSSPDEFKNILDMNESLDDIRRIMKQNLEKKQNNCSRLCFLGYESLVIFLTELAKRKSLRIGQLFPGIESIDISESNIQAVNRPGYTLHLVRPVTLFLVNKPLTLDTWVIDLEIALIQTFKEHLKKALDTSEDIWGKEHDLQILIVAQMILFSQQVFSPDLKDKLLASHSRLIEQIRKERMTNATTRTYASLEKLSIVFISQLDTLELISKDPLNWDFSIKYCYNEEDLKVEALHYSIDYCYEFHKMEETSYIPTPISEKIMLHIINSFTGYQPVLLSGSGASGKTSVIKEIALICGKGICFWTAVHGTSLDTLFSAVSGCASGGFWAVIEEIQNTETLVFSSLLFYMKEIVKGLKSKQNRVHLFDKFYKIKEGFSVFFTTSTKSPIPAFLTSSLRALHITRPDFKVLVSCKLTALGFDLTYLEQITLVFKLISDNFESIVGENRQTSLAKSLNYLNKLVHILPYSMTESSIVEAFHKLFLSEVAGCERKILNEILNSVFPMARFEFEASPQAAPLIGCGLSQSAELRQQITILLDMIQARDKWIFVVGPACSGKSTLLSLAASEYCKKHAAGFLLHKLQNSGAEALMKLIGLCERFEDNGSSYCSYPVGNAKSPSACDWVVIDAPLPVDWDTLNYVTRGELYLNVARRVTVPKEMKFFVECENLNEFTPADLRNYGIVSLSEAGLSAQEIFVSKLEKLDDPEISKVFLALFSTLVQAVYFSLSNTYFNYSLKVWTLQLWRILDRLVKEAKSLLSKKYDSLYTQINKKKTKAKLKKPLGESTLADSIVIRDSYSPIEVDKKTEIIVNTIEFLNLSRNPPPINTKLMYESIFLFAVINTFGFCEKDKQKFHKVILDFLSRQPENFANGVRDKIKIKSVLDICYIIETQQWVEWGEDVFNASKNKVKRQLTLRKSTLAVIEATKMIDSIYIQSSDTTRQVYWLTYFLNSSISAIVLGMHQTGKSMLSSLVLKKFLSKGYVSYLPISLTSNTSVSSIQNLICLSLEQVKKFYFAHVGGIKQYVYIDDLNLDSSNGFYELFRFWKENRGWYNKDFYFIGQTEVLGVHGYSANRGLYARALRHFNVIFKEPYSNKDVTRIFRSIIDSDSISVSRSRGELMSNTDMAVEFYKKLFIKLSKVETERLSYNFSLTTFILALRKITELESLDNMENDNFMKHFTSILKLYITNQISETTPEIHELVFTSYSVFFTEVMEDSVDDKKLYSESYLVDQSIFTQSSPEYIALNPQILTKIIEKFDSTVDQTRTKHYEELRNLKYLFNNPEETLGKYILFYISLLFEIQDRKSCTICTSDLESSLVKSIAFVAARTLDLPIFNFSSKDTRFKDFSSVSEAYLPIEAKFMLREVILKAGIENKAGIVLIELPEIIKDNYSMTILETFNDLFVGGALKNGASFKYYKDIIVRIKREGSDLKSIENDQVMVTTIERIRTNVKVLIVVQGKIQSFSRFSHEKSIEALKHRFRSLFNFSKIINFDAITVPRFVIEGVIIQEKVLEKWIRENNRAFFTDYFKKCEEITKARFSDVDLEKISFVASEVMRKNDKRLKQNIRNLEVASKRVHEIETEISNFSKKEQSIEQELKKLKEELSFLDQEKSKIAGRLLHISSTSYVPPFAQEFLDEKSAFLSKLSQSKQEFEDSLNSILNSRVDFSELSSTTSFQPGMVLCSAYLHFLTMPKSKWPAGFTLEQLEPLSKPFINSITFNFATLNKKLKKIQVDSLPYLEEVISSPLFSNHLNGKGYKQYRLLSRFIEAMFKYRRVLEEHTKVKVDWAKTEEVLPEQIQQAVSEANSRLTGQKIVNEQETLRVDSQIQLLSKIKDNIEKKWKRILKMSQDLNQKNLKWIEELKTLKELKKNLAHDSLFVAVELVSALRFRNPVRGVLMEAAAEILARRYPGFVGVPKFPSNGFNHLLSIMTNGKMYRGLHLLDKLAFFCKSVAGVMGVFRYALPYPWVLDTFKVFTEFLHSAEEDIYEFSLETGFENKLEVLMNEGRAAVIVNPSQAALLALHSLIQCRVNYYLFRSRGISTENLEFRIANVTIKFNPKFRLYFCSDSIFEESQHLFSIFSLELEGQDWKQMMYLKILKHIDTEFTSNKEDNYKNLYSHKDQTLFEEKEVVNKLQVEYNKENPLGFFDFLDEVWNSLFINDSEVPKHQKHLFKEEGELFTVDCPQLLDSLHRIYEICVQIQDQVSPFQISARMYLDMVLDTIKDFYHNTTDINFAQMTASVDAIVYSLFCFIYNSMPNQQATVFCYYFIVSKYLELNPGLGKESLALLEETSRPGEMTAEEVFDKLKTSYSNLLSEDFALDSLQKLKSSDLYRTVKLPKSYKVPVKLFIYSKLRVDLLPLIPFELLNDTLASRYSYIPSPSFNRFDLTCEAKRPIFILYESNLPFKSIEEESSRFEVKEPILKFSGNERKEVAQTNFRELEKSLNYEHRASNWIVIDKANVMSPAEVEFLAKAILNASQNPRFRIFLIVHGKIQDFPHLLPLFSISYRMCFKHPASVKDRFQDWMRWYSKDHRQKENLKKLDLFRDHLSNNVNLFKSQRSKFKNRGKGVLRKDKNVRMFTNLIFNRISLIQTEQYTVDVANALYYNMALFVGFTFLRCRFSQCRTLSYMDTFLVLEGLQSYLSKKKQSEQASVMLKIIDAFWPSEFWKMFECMIKGKSQNIEVDVGLDKLKYPLYLPNRRDDADELEDLVECMAAEDHLKVVGIDHERFIRKRVKMGRVIREGVVKSAQKFWALHEGSALVDGNPGLVRDFGEWGKELELRFERFRTLVPDKSEMSIVNKDPILQAFWRHEIKDYESLLSLVQSTLTSLIKYLNYNNSLILSYQKESLDALSSNKLPLHWRKHEPYCLKDIKTPEDWLQKLGKILQSKLDRNLSISFKPQRYFYLYIRNLKGKKISLKALPDPNGIQGLVVKNGKIVDGLLVDDEKDYNIPPFNIEIDADDKVSQSYVLFGDKENVVYENYVTLKMLESENFYALFPSFLEVKTCEFRFMKVELGNNLDL